MMATAPVAKAKEGNTQFVVCKNIKALENIQRTTTGPLLSFPSPRALPISLFC